MPERLDRIAKVTQVWGLRADLAESDRRFARKVGELADFLSHRPFPHQDDLNSLYILGCRLCRRIEAVECCDPQSNCVLGFAQAY